MNLNTWGNLMNDGFTKNRHTVIRGHSKTKISRKLFFYSLFYYDTIVFLLHCAANLGKSKLLEYFFVLDDCKRFVIVIRIELQAVSVGETQVNGSIRIATEKLYLL